MIDVKHIAKLARLELKEKEIPKLEKDLEEILGFVEQLKEVDTENIKPTSQVTGLENVMRPDEAKKSDEKKRRAILANAPETKDGYIKVKAVFE